MRDKNSIIKQMPTIEETKQLILSGKLNVNAIDEKGQPLLYLAACGGLKETVELLLEHGADPNIKYNNYPVLYYVASMDHNYDVTELLLKHRAEPNISGPGEIPLINDIVMSGDYKMTKLLLDYGANPNGDDAGKDTALGSAVTKTNDDISAIKEALAMKMSYEVASDREMVDLLLKYGANPSSGLGHAAYSGDLSMINLLIDHGANVNHQDIGGWTPLMYAAKYNHLKCAKLLLQLGADDKIVNKKGDTAISLAQKQSNDKIVNSLVGPQTKRVTLEDIDDIKSLSGTSTNLTTMKKTNSNVKGNIALGLGIASVFLWEFSIFPLLAIIFGIVGIVTGQKQKLSTGTAIAGLVLGIIFLFVRIANGV